MIPNSNRNGNANSGKVSINGHTYQTVAYRLAEFRKQYSIESGWSIETKCLQCNGEKIIFQATIKNPNGQAVATGHAEEKRDESYINRTSALENAETLAIGRALAGAGFIGSEFASADEIALALQEKPTGQTPVQCVEPTCETKAKVAEPNSQAAKPSEAQSQKKPEKAEQSQEQAKQQKQSQANEQPAEEIAERWAREHLAEWLDSPCSFGKALGRTWRQLAENKGPQVIVNGKASSPRAYLHALSSWTKGKVWQRAKAKVALEVCKNGNGDSHLAALSA